MNIYMIKAYGSSRNQTDTAAGQQFGSTFIDTTNNQSIGVFHHFWSKTFCRNINDVSYRLCYSFQERNCIICNYFHFEFLRFMYICWRRSTLRLYKEIISVFPD